MHPAALHHPPSSFKKTVGLALGAAAAVCLVLLAFAWPGVTSHPHDIPIGIVGPDAQVEQVQTQVSEEADGALKFEHFDDRAAAITAIREREVYGALVLSAGDGNAPGAPEMLIATAGNSAVAQMLQGMATQLQTQLTAQVNAGVEGQVQKLIDTLKGIMSGQAPSTANDPAPQFPETFTMPDVHVTITDVVPLSPDDPRGAGLAAAALPLVMGGMIGAILISSAIHGSRRRLVALGVYTLVAGIAISAILGGWFGALQGNYWLNVLAITLSIGAISATLVGLRGMFGSPGLAFGAVLMFFFANPISGAAMPPEFLVGSWGVVGQWFPPGPGRR